MNESYVQPPMPKGVEADILKGMYRLRKVGKDDGKRVRLLGSGAILREVEAAAEMLHETYGVSSEIFSVTSFNELAREAQDVTRWNLLHPDLKPRVSHVAKMLDGDAPVIASSDYVKSLSEQIRSQIRAPFHVLGTDGFGRSDTREELRHFFEVDRRFVTLAALKSLADAQKLSVDIVRKALDDLSVDPEKTNPRLV
jgi:pyruvate dehydrogenase E1 component